MKKHIILAVSALLMSTSVFAQKYFTKSGHVNFYSHTPVEDITADNHQVKAVIDFTTGDVSFSMAMKSFQFKKKKMQEHFNENFLHTDEFPKAKFKGKITNLSEIDLTKDGVYPAKITGKMTIHGVTKAMTINTKTKVIVKNGIVSIKSTFEVNRDDHNIGVKKKLEKKIAKKMKITVKATLKKLVKKK